MMKKPDRNRFAARSFGRRIAFQLLYRRDVNPNAADGAIDTFDGPDGAFLAQELSSGLVSSEESDENIAVNVGEDAGPVLSMTDSDQIAAWVKSLLADWTANRQAIDSAISDAAQNWSLSRMAATDRNILRLAVIELQSGETPPAVVISEAIELAKKFGAADSGAFVNGVLGRVAAKFF